MKTEQAATRGVDLENRAGEVRKLIYKKFGKYILSLGFEFDDVMQEIYVGIIGRNGGINPWDSTISKFGYYIYLVGASIISNYRLKHSKYKKSEVPFKENKRDIKGEINEEALEFLLDYSNYLNSLKDIKIPHREIAIAIEILPYVYLGYSKLLIAEATGLLFGQVSIGRKVLSQSYRDYLRP